MQYNINEIMRREYAASEGRACFEMSRQREARARRSEKRMHIVEAALAIFIVLCAGSAIVYLKVTEPKRDRIAWTEGYFGVDHATAVAMVETGKAVR